MVLTSILAIFYIDQPLTRWMHENVQPKFLSAAEVVTWFGLGDTYFMIAVFGYLLARLFTKKWTHLGWVRRWGEAKTNFIFMFYSFFVSGILVLFLKAFFGRCRPYHSVNYAPLDFQPLTLDWHYQSYPSGHTQVGFTLATFLSVLFPKFTKYFYCLAAFIGFSRVVLEKHYLGDVIAGAFVGILGTYVAWHWRGKYLLPHITHQH
ncbi:MAG: hypothetical protein RJB66_2417 [Pseudomonadota bacterium]